MPGWLMALQTIIIQTTIFKIPYALNHNAKCYFSVNEVDLYWGEKVKQNTNW